MSHKKNFLVILAALTISSLFATTAMAAASFPDVPADHIDYGAVEYLKAKGVIAGYDDSTFRPERTINRAEALKIVLLASGKAGESTRELPFDDVKGDDWFRGFVAKGFDLGIVKGYDDGSFKPGNNINVAESLKMILHSFDLAAPTALELSPYPDVGKDLWYAPYAAVCKSKQLIWPLGDGKLHADREITRGEFSQIIYRLMYVRENKLEKFPMSLDWLTFTHSSDRYLIKRPFDWQIIRAEKQTVFWKRDTDNAQIGFGRQYPNSATLIVAVDKNEKSATFDAFLNALPYFNTGTTQRMTLNGYPFAVVTFTSLNRVDYYFELPNKTFLALYADTGDGANSQYLIEEIRNMVGSVRYAESAEGDDRDSLLSKVRAMILVEGKGDEALNMFNEIILIETDTIGIGTGPVDYYYDSENEVTLKYERTSDTLLQIRDGRTTAF